MNENTGHIPENDDLKRLKKAKARIAYGLIWISSTIAMFIAVAAMLFRTGANQHNMDFYIPVIAFAAIMAVVIPLTVKITKLYS